MPFRIYLLLLLLLALSCQEPPGPVPDDRINDYALYDSAGGFHRFSRYNNKKALVLFVQGNGCPIVRNYLSDLKEIVNTYRPKDVEFFMVNSNVQDISETVQLEVESYGIEIPVLMDQYQILADKLDIHITAEVIILHPVTREILYRGPVSDRLDYEVQKDQASKNYLKEALDGILQGKEVSSMPKAVKGCKVTRRTKFERNDSLNYTDDIAPILRDYCVRCHREGGMAPWAMTDYQTIVGWSDMMEQVLLSRRMPPWKADPKIGHFSNSFAMPDDARRKVLNWINNGLEAGIGDDPLINASAAEEGWSMGEPDKIIQLKQEELPATGVIPYRYQTVVLKDTVDRWVSAIDVKPGNAQVVHHIVIVNEAVKREESIVNRDFLPWNDDFLAISTGAGTLNKFPEDTGIFLPKNSTWSIQIHYTPIGKPDKDQTAIGIYYHQTPPQREYLSLSPTRRDIIIPPYTDEVQWTARDTVRKDILIHALGPHMHYRGKRARFEVIRPDGVTETVVSIPDYDFNWQYKYELASPMLVPKGSVLQFTGVYDNTYQNPLNPDPSKKVAFGLQSLDEMLIGFMNYTLVDKDTLTIN